jgi:predicted phosphoribosyltransferase
MPDFRERSVWGGGTSAHDEPLVFENREHAGRVLAERLRKYAGRDDVLVLALPRGGVPVAFEVAQALRAPLDLFLVRKLGVPGHEELAMGAIASGGVRVLNHEVVDSLGIPSSAIERTAASEERELKRREQAYRGSRPAPEVEGRTVILIDDGLATGSSMRAAVAALTQQKPARIVVAVPVAAPSTCEEFRAEVDEIVCATTPEPFLAVGRWYHDFAQTSDEEVRLLLDRAQRGGSGAS